jgi:TorA maturation chaperone TorD
MAVHIRTDAAKAENEISSRKSRGLVRAVGGFIELTKRTAASQLRVSSLSHVPKHPLSVGAVMDLENEILWPEHRREQPVEIDDIDASRAQEYSLLAMLLSRSPNAETLGRIAKLSGDTTSLGLAHVALAQAAGSANVERIAREYFTLFVGVGRGELLPYGSYYLTGFLNERPLARLREDLGAHGIERAEGQAEPEDHAATLCEIMAGMASGQFPVTDRIQRRFFEKHLASWIGRFFVDLERAEAAEFYRHVGALGQLFLQTETEAFTLPA